MVADNTEGGNVSVTAPTSTGSKYNVGIEEELPEGNFIMVSVDIDTTGRRLIDEIVQLAAYTPDDHFEQYIMPYMNLNPAARQRHQVRVISIGFYRMLKSMQTYKIIKSKSEIAALKDFLNWLEHLKLNNPNSDGIVLLYHEERKFIPYMILESLKKYGLLERFTKSVKSFANSLNLAKASLGDNHTKHYSLRKLSKMLSLKASSTSSTTSTTKEETSSSSGDTVADSTSTSNSNAGSSIGIEKSNAPKNNLEYERDIFDGNASVRAKLTFNVALQLSNSKAAIEVESSDALDNLFNALQPFAKPIEADIRELDNQNDNLERQNSFRPVFLNYFKTTLYHRVRAVKFRIVLAENGFDLSSLNNIWTENRSAGLEVALQSITNLKAEDKTELVELLDSYFDPNKTIIKPVVKSNNNRRRSRRANGPSSAKSVTTGGTSSSRSASTEFGAGGDKPSVPDSTTMKTQSPNKTGKNAGAVRPRKRSSRRSLPSSEVKATEVSEESSSIKEQLNKTVPAIPVGTSSPNTITQIPIAASN
ncbi:maternal protein exuperantia [Drosophila tropicalis]|uniref:maternal protein exuperantia n=1 Tax=Drosophila tropicalis TaxID=46794 RepID=UPI0035ABD8E3